MFLTHFFYFPEFGDPSRRFCRFVAPNHVFYKGFGIVWHQTVLFTMVMAFHWIHFWCSWTKYGHFVETICAFYFCFFTPLVSFSFLFSRFTTPLVSFSFSCFLVSFLLFCVSCFELVCERRATTGPLAKNVTVEVYIMCYLCCFDVCAGASAHGALMYNKHVLSMRMYVNNKEVFTSQSFLFSRISDLVSA